MRPADWHITQGRKGGKAWAATQSREQLQERAKMMVNAKKKKAAGSADYLAKWLAADKAREKSEELGVMSRREFDALP
jgi:hypothetical protein